MGFLGNLFKGLFGGSTSNRRTNEDEDVHLNIKESLNVIFGEGYEVKRNVNVSTLGEYDTTYDLSYVVYDNEGTAKVAIIVLYHNGQANRNFRNLRKACEENNIPFVHFYNHMWNKRDYVENRIRTAL